MKYANCMLIVPTLLVTSTAASAAPLVSDPALQQAGLSRFWSAQLPLSEGDGLQKGYLVDDTLYVVTDGGTLFSLDAGSGLIRWADKVADRNYVILRPTHNGPVESARRVVISTSRGIVIRDRFSGEVVTQLGGETAASAPVAAVGERLFIGGLDGRIRAIDYVPSGDRVPFMRWTVQTGGAIKAAPVLVSDQILLFASSDGRVYCCDPNDKTLRWSFGTAGPVVADPAVGAGSAFVAGTDRILYKLDLRTGRPAWRMRTPSPLTTSPVVVGDTVYQLVPREGLVVIAVDDGKQRWRCPEGRAFCSRSRDSDVVFTEDGRLNVMDHDTGELRNSLFVDGAAVTAVNAHDDAVFVLGKDGRVLCARVDRVPYLRRQQVLAAEARLNVSPDAGTVVAPAPPVEGPPAVDPRAEDPLRSRHDRRP